ncbi:MAG: AAA family ATPase [Thermoplasmata archaeon]|nr:AAA family ATPase [Thermoplasmata archaeon]
MSRKLVDTSGLPFRELRGEGMYYVDKTLLIKDILDRNPRGKFLFVRPRRFGKSTNISMLDAFFNEKYSGNTWFEGLKISDYPEYDVYRNAFPVIHIDFQNTVSTTYDMFLDKIRGEVLRAYEDHRYLLDGDLTAGQRRTFEELSNGSIAEGELSGSLKVLSEMLRSHHGKNVVVLMDEYDRAVTNAFDTDLQGRMICFMGDLMTAVLKGNDCIQMAYVTGVMQLAKAGMFSGLNNVTVDSVFSTMSDDRFGFTEEEVGDLLDHYGRRDRMDEVRTWYDGYRFGNARVYNPYSVMMYVSEGFVPDDYWASTGGTKPLEWMLGHMDIDGLGIAATLFDGTPETVRLKRKLTYDDLKLTRVEDLYTLMVMTGYCRAEPDGSRYSIGLPNREVQNIVGEMLSDTVSLSSGLFEEFCEAVRTGDSDAVASSLRKVLEDASYYEKLDDERSYELVVLTMLHGLHGAYAIRSQPECGRGRADLVLTPRAAGGATVIMELKVAPSEEAVDSSLDAALGQIHDRRYYMGMSGRVVLIGLAFSGKAVGCRSEVLVLDRSGRDGR